MEGSKWHTFEEAKKAAEKYIISQGKSWKKYKADQRCWVRICQNRTECDFRIQFNITSVGHVDSTIFTLYICPRTPNAKPRLGQGILFCFYLQINDRLALLKKIAIINLNSWWLKKWLDRDNKINYQ